MNANQLIESKYLAASDLHGQDQIVTIKDVEIETIGQDKQRKPVIYFKNIPKGMILNKINIKAICQALNETETEEWVGRKITLYEGEAQTFSGDLVPALRVRPKAPSATKAAPQKRTDDDDAEEERPAPKRKPTVQDDDEVPF